jgi:glycosyltransferase involved in cell wall biosynthesis
MVETTTAPKNNDSLDEQALMEKADSAPAAQSTPQPAGGDAGDGKTHVLYLNHVTQMSGAEQSLRALLWQFRRRGGEVDPVIALPGDGPFSQVLREEGWNVTFAPLRRLHRPQGFLDGMASLVHIFQTAPYLAKLARQAGAQIIHSNSTTAHLVGALAAERMRLPSVWHARDLVSLERIAPSLSQKTSVVVAISNAVSERLKADGVPEDKIRVIYNGLDPDEWRPRDQAASTLRESLGMNESTFLFGCASQLVPWKNHRAFIQAAAQLANDDKCDNARFAIIGGDLWGEQQEYVRELRGLVKEYSLQDRFNFIPHQNDNEDVLTALDAVVLPSREEPFGRVLIEAMALRKVAIAFDSGGPREIITHEKDGLLAPLAPAEENETAEQKTSREQADADSLAHVMKRALRGDALREDLGAAARQTVCDRFHIGESAHAIMELYRELLS